MAMRHISKQCKESAELPHTLTSVHAHVSVARLSHQEFLCIHVHYIPDQFMMTAEKGARLHALQYNNVRQCPEL